jgi:hypothetical protein
VINFYKRNGFVEVKDEKLKKDEEKNKAFPLVSFLQL